ncbi:lytic murein transglycosylase [Loktanella sp. F6476L]|uniref:lytic murein transglycosylase n=1 Tax=Loktanella sp. F6476L TaxID=2926405 RepID=UPI001FF478B3|nr:lytic murein transglycosylase [Loktanella sp. F6476L]MCK0121137.1 lytic murein transglycosylase [Loktanella sp. F6476L]
MRRLAFALSMLASPAVAQTCGGPLPAFLAGVKAEAVANGLSPTAADRVLNGAQIDQRVLNADRSQGVFQKDFIAFSRALISQNRIDNGVEAARRNAVTFDRIEAQFGIPREVILAFWAFETDYGSFQGDFNTRNALVTLAHDCRRPELFRPQLIAAIELNERGNFNPDTTTGAWAGEIGQVQMLPGDIIESGLDGDGDGKIDLKGSAADALMSGANVLSGLGWKPNQPWLQEIRVPDTLDWAQTGLKHPKTVAEWNALGVTSRDGTAPTNLTARVVLPMGRNGPAFFAYDNFDVYFEWNQSFVYVTTAAYFATRLAGGPVYDAGNPTPGLSGDQMQALQSKLAARGHDVGGIDGILGAKTRDAIQVEQRRLGLPADAWPTTGLLNAL